MGSTTGRAAWTGAVSFGLVNVPVRMHKATEEKSVRFNQLHIGCGARVRMPKVCENGHDIGTTAEIVKGYAVSKDEYVVMDEADFDSLPIGSRKVIDVEVFVDAADIDTSAYAGSYYLEAEDAGKRGYALLHRAMTTQKKVAIGKVSFREGREHMVVIRPVAGAFMVHTLHWPDEVREIGFEDVTGVKLAKAELDTAKLLVGNMSGTYDPEEFHDTYREALLARIDTKLQGLPAPAPAPKREAAADLMEALQASVKASKRKKAS